ncbi:GCN5-related N-acetyltransferase [Coriobacterium glomerans PW2]|uniref:GCN5-related N-acetyltransferase n=1 Tax=Coriobacterium glomerans (strain ATCC 49209 / DSM 20642 / JCM 10262 / PW2) TaxID=700015 RepID=F2N746_CORGP|nr:GNAT family N-acetyltransferase [Coriobacterium glomerans]AEB06385.1 GCN5-related N-acetyltransferase [Coriobacterium glomerans PW2]
MVIETERLLLRPWEDADAAELYLLVRDPVIGDNAGWPAHTSEAMSLQVIRDVLRGDEQYAITLRAPHGPGRDGGAADAATSCPLVGAIGLKSKGVSAFVTSPTEYEVGYWIGREHWGKGYAPEAMRALIEHARDELGCTVIWADYYLGNDRSRRVMEKCGLGFARVERDVDVPLLGEKRDAVVMRRDLTSSAGSV